jgi:antitoxin (DNA-binding transcriptional repressor) of toxin-antitoxin stability system
MASVDPVDVGVREFRSHVAQYLQGTQPLAVRRHGRIIGYYIPVARDEKRTSAALDRLEEAIDGLLAGGMTETELREVLGGTTHADTDV